MFKFFIMFNNGFVFDCVIWLYFKFKVFIGNNLFFIELVIFFKFKIELCERNFFLILDYL